MNNLAEQGQESSLPFVVFFDVCPLQRHGSSISMLKNHILDSLASKPVDAIVNI